MKFVKLDNNNRVTFTRTGKHVLDGEFIIDSNILVKQGQVYNPENGTFSDYVLTPEELAEQEKQVEIYELNKWLDLRRNIEHPEKAAKQARLLELLG